MKRFALFFAASVVLVIALAGWNQLGLRMGMTRQEIESRFAPGRLTAPGSFLFHNDRLGLFVGRRNFLIATQQVTIRLDMNGKATNVQSRWSWRTTL